MFAFTETIEVVAPKHSVWDLMCDIREWWPPSNPEHESLDFLDGSSEIGVGTRLRIRERVAGVPGEAVGTITRFEVGDEVTWEAPEARYRLFGVPVMVAEGVTWTFVARGSRTQVSAHVWSALPHRWLGRILEWGFKLLGGVDKDRKHARQELAYLKQRIEMGAPSREDTAPP